MPDLVAFGPGGEPRWRRPLPLRPVTPGLVPGATGGIGVAGVPAAVGQFGTRSPSRVGGFRPALNPAARPGPMTETFHVPVPCDGPPTAGGPTRTLKDFMERHHHNPPAGWDGVIVLQAK